MFNFFKKKQADDSVAAKKSWYEDKYQTVVVQRNFLVVLIIFSLAGIMVSTLAVIKVTSTKKIEPFVIEIEEKTGITNVIRPLIKEQFAYDDALRRYFLVRYLMSRETYEQPSYEYNYNTIVRLLSNSAVYAQFRRVLSSDNPDNPTKLGSASRTIKIKSITPIKTSKDVPGQTFQVRFSVDTNVQSFVRTKNLIATISFDYFDLSLTQEERSINPLGFQVIGYRVDEEAL